MDPAMFGSIVFTVLAIFALLGAMFLLERDSPLSVLLGIMAIVLLLMAGSFWSKGKPNNSELVSGEVRELLCSAPYPDGKSIGALLKKSDGELEFRQMEKNPPAKIFASKGNGEYVPYPDGK